MRVTCTAARNTLGYEAVQPLRHVGIGLDEVRVKKDRFYGKITQWPLTAGLLGHFLFLKVFNIPN